MADEVELGIIPDALRVLLVALLAEESGYEGITYMAVGEGNSDWDSIGTPEPDPGQTTLVAELFRKVVTLGYLDENGDPSVAPTNRLKCTTTFDAGEGTGTWRELALFGGTATGSPDTGEICAIYNFPAVTKDAGVALTRVVKLTT